MSDPSFTPAQLRALAWLPSDGTNASGDPLGFEVALKRLRRGGYASYYKIGPASEVARVHYLTPSGVRLKAELIANGKLKQ